LSRTIPAYKNNGFTAEISLLSGFVINEQVIVNGLDLGWINITSVDSVVTVDSAVFTSAISVGIYKPIFCANKGATFPTVDISATLNTNTVDSCFISAIGGSSNIKYNGASIDKFETALYADESGLITGGANVALTNCSGRPILCQGSAEVDYSGRNIDARFAADSIRLASSSLTANSVDVRDISNVRGLQVDYGSNFKTVFLYAGNGQGGAGYYGGISVTSGSNVICTTLSMDRGRGLGALFINNNSDVSIIDCTINNSEGSGVFIRGAKLYVAGNGLTCQSSADYSVDCGAGTIISDGNSDVRYAGIDSLYIHDGSRCVFSQSLNSLTSSGFGINCAGGSIVTVGTLLDGSTNITPNTFTSSGIIWT